MTGDDAPPADAAPDADPADMTPAPPAETGTPAAAVPDDGTVTKSITTPDVFAALESAVAKAVAAALDGRTPHEDIAKQGDVAGLLEEVETLKARLATVEEQPAAPKVFTNGAVPPANMLRGQDKGAGPVDVAKAPEMRGGSAMLTRSSRTGSRTRCSRPRSVTSPCSTGGTSPPQSAIPQVPRT